MATTTNRRRPARPAGGKNALGSTRAVEFARGSLESDLSAIGRSVPAAEWAKVPRDYFANLDHYLRGAPKNK